MQKIKPDYHYIIGDSRDISQVDYAVRQADIIFHASALKQVPSCETYPFEAVKTNVMGSDTIYAILQFDIRSKPSLRIQYRQSRKANQCHGNL